MDAAKQKSFEFANDTIKLMLGLTTGLLAFTATFLKDVIGSKQVLHKGFLSLSWVFLISAIFFFIWSLFSIAGTLNAYSKANETQVSSIDIYNTNITAPSSAGILFFLIGVALYTYFVYINL